MKKFFFWFGVLALAIVVAHLITDWIKTCKNTLAIKPRGECGFHAIWKGYQLPTA
jgi:hypothetical protein